MQVQEQYAKGRSALWILFAAFAPCVLFLACVYILIFKFFDLVQEVDVCWDFNCVDLSMGTSNNASIMNVPLEYDEHLSLCLGRSTW